MKDSNKEKQISNYLDELYPDAHCELNYQKDYELLIATVLSAQCTDKRVNKVTDILWQKYDIFSLANANQKDIEKIIYPVGSYTKKASYLKIIATRLTKDYEGHVPNDREYLESLPGVGRKTCGALQKALLPQRRKGLCRNALHRGRGGRLAHSGHVSAHRQGAEDRDRQRGAPADKPRGVHTGYYVFGKILYGKRGV